MTLRDLLWVPLITAVLSKVFPPSADDDADNIEQIEPASIGMNSGLNCDTLGVNFGLSCSCVVPVTTQGLKRKLGVTGGTVVGTKGGDVLGETEQGLFALCAICSSAP